MRRLTPAATACWIAILVAVTPTAVADTGANPHSALGELILAPLDTAPFPHPKRSEGHKYQDTNYLAATHYRDSTVAIFIPKQFRETGRVDFVVHFHGWRNSVTNVLHEFELIEQLCDSRRNAVLVVPQGPLNAPDSFGGKLEDPGGFKRFMDDVVAAIRANSSLTNRNFTPGDILLSGHSGGYQVISSILDVGGLTNRVKEVWLFDALYARGEKFLAWQDHAQGRLINIYTDDGGTKERTGELMAQLKKRGTPFWSGAETNLTPAELRTNRWVFIHTQLGHNGVLAEHRTFRDYLATSCLADTLETNLLVTPTRLDAPDRRNESRTK